MVAIVLLTTTIPNVAQAKGYGDVRTSMKTILDIFNCRMIVEWDQHYQPGANFTSSVALNRYSVIATNIITGSTIILVANFARLFPTTIA